MVQQIARGNPDFAPSLAKAPANLGTVFSRMQVQAIGTPLQMPEDFRVAVAAKFGLRPQAGNACGPANTPADNDGDGIPNSFTYTFDCGGSLYAGQAASLTGSVSITDLGINDPNSGYDVKLTNLIFAYVDTNIDTGFAFGTNMDTKVRVGANGKYNVTQSFEFGAVTIKDGETSTFEFISNGTLEFTPAPNATNATRFAKGTLKFRNKFSFKVNINGKTYESELEMYSTGMQVDQATCGRDNMVNSGDIKFTDGKNTLTWTITGCGDGTWNYQ